MRRVLMLSVALAAFGGCAKQAEPAPAAVTPVPAPVAAPAPAVPEPGVAGAPAAPAAPAHPAAAPAAGPASAAAPEVAAPAAVAQLGQAAPDFTLADTDGGTWSLAAHKGKLVVVEWFNPGCPFVKYAYEEGPLAGLEAKLASEDLVWVRINSGAPGKQGHGLETNKAAREGWKIASPVLVDEDGRVGRLYEARTTPHLYIVDKQGVLVYRGALDNAPLGKVEVEGAAVTNYVEAAIGDLRGGRPVATPETVAYGCSVKY